MKMPISLRVLVASIAALFVSHSAHASLLLYEGFAYAPGTNLNGATGGSGFAPASSWNTVATSGNGSGFVQIQPAGSASGVYLNNGTTINPYTGTYANLPSTGNYAGANDGGAGTTSLAPGVADHIYLWRALDSTVTSSFVNGSSTYFSYSSTRAYNANARAPSFTLGSGILYSGGGEQRGDSVTTGPGNTSMQTIAVGGITETGGNIAPNTWTLNGVNQTSTLGGVSMFRAQYFNSTGTRSYLAGAAGTVGGAALSSTAGTGPQPGDHGYWMQGGGGASSLLYGYSSANTPSGLGDNASHVNITVGRIQWGAGSGGEDVISFYVFHDLDALSEAAFNSGALSWTTPEVSTDRAQFNYLSIGGGRFFVDELRIGTTFNDALGIVPEPSAAWLSLLGLGALLRRRRN